MSHIMLDLETLGTRSDASNQTEHLIAIARKHGNFLVDADDH